MRVSTDRSVYPSNYSTAKSVRGDPYTFTDTSARGIIPRPDMSANPSGSQRTHLPVELLHGQICLRILKGHGHICPWNYSTARYVCDSLGSSRRSGHGICLALTQRRALRPQKRRECVDFHIKNMFSVPIQRGVLRRQRRYEKRNFFLYKATFSAP